MSATRNRDLPRDRFASWLLAALSLTLACLLAAGCALSGRPATAAPTATPLAQSPTATPPAPVPSPTPVVELPPAPVNSAVAALLLDPSTGGVLLTQNADQRLPMASTTKIMTAVVAITAGKLDQRITIGPDATALDHSEDSVAGLKLGDSLTLQDLLYALMLPSGDDAAIAIADGVAGSQSAFVSLMNLEALLLGLRDTHYADVHGLDTPGHYTTARDLAALTRFAMRFPIFAQVVGTASYTLPATEHHHAYSWQTTNKLLSTLLYPGAIGAKTGYTGNAGDCLVFVAKRPYGELIGVLLGEPNDQARFGDATALLNWGFAIEAQSPHEIARGRTGMR